MANLVTTADFKGEIAISQSAGDSSMGSALCLNIAEYEPLFMRFALGDEIVELIGDWTEAGLAQRWKDVRDGVTYTVNGKTIKFDGIKRLAARYIYSVHLEQLQQSTTPVGVKEERAANSETTNLFKSCRQWNKMSDGMNGLWDLLYNRVETNGDKVYPEFEVCNIEIDRFRPKNLLGI